MLVNVDLGNGVISQMDDADLTPNHSVIDNEHERTAITEFRLNDKVVHRSVHVHLKQGIGIEGVLGSIG
jgi:hypothetical protein